MIVYARRLIFTALPLRNANAASRGTPVVSTCQCPTRTDWLLAGGYYFGRVPYHHVHHICDAIASTVHRESDTHLLTMPWHYCPEEVFTLPQIWSGSGAGFRKLLKGLPRPHPDPQLEWHLQLFDQYTRLKHGLERRRRVALLSDQDLRKLRIVRGAPLDIDDIRPIDVEKRFFLPAHPKWVKWFAKQFFKRKERWPTPAPEECWEEDADGNRVTNIHHVNHYCAALARMTEWYDQSRGIWFANPWWTMRGYVSPPRCDCFQKKMGNY